MVDPERAETEFKALISEWSKYLGSRDIEDLLSPYANSCQLSRHAAILFDALDPVLSFSLAIDCINRLQWVAALEAHWAAAECMLLGIGVHLGGFEWVDPWAHGKTVSTARFLEEFRDKAERRGIPRHLTNVFVSGANLLHTALTVPKSEIHEAELLARSGLYLTSTLFQFGRRLRDALGIEADPPHLLWKTVPDIITSRSSGGNWNV
jgi:hypothetical protein